MKKLGIALLSCLLLAGMILPMAVCAEEAPAVTGIEQNLVIHYDFEGETLDEQLQDKAQAGVSQENLTLVATTDETTQEPDSYIKDGVAHIDHAIQNYMNVGFSTESNIGTDVWNCATNGEITTFVAFKASGAPQAWATALDFDDIERVILKGASENTAIFAAMGVRGTTSMNNNANVDFTMKNADVYLDTDVVYVAVSWQYDASAKKLVGTVYHSFDYGKTYTETMALFEEVDAFITESNHICFGKTRAGNQFKKTDHGTSYDFYDFRVYNKALSLDEVKTIQTGHEPAETPDDPNEGDDLTDEIFEDEETDPEDEETTAAPVTTEAATTADTTDSEKKSGCGSAISVGVFSTMGLIAAASVTLNKKKKRPTESR